MKGWVKLLIFTSVWAQILLISAPVLFAQRVPVRYKPPKNTARSVGAAATTRIPYVVNPRLPVATQQRVAAFSGTVVDRNISNRVVEAAHQVTNHTPANPVSVNMRPVTTPLKTGLQALQTWRPGWRSELQLAGFTETQLNAVEQTFIDTDEFLFEVDEDGTWLSPAEGSTEWEYRNRFSQILTSGTVPFTEGHLKVLFGKFSRLDDVFTHLEEQAFVLVYKRMPKPNAPGEEGRLARHVRYNTNKMYPSMNPEVEGYIYGQRQVVVAQNTPVRLNTPKPSYGPRGRSPNRTSEQVWEELLQFMREHNGEIPKRDAEDEYERKLRKAWDSIYERKQGSNDPYVQRLIKLHDEKVKQYKTPQKILDYMVAYMPEHNGKLPPQDSKDEVAKSNRMALNYFHRKYKDLTDEQVEALPEPDRTLEKLFRQEVKQYADDKTPQEILDYMVAYMPEHNGKLPPPDSKDEVAKSHRIALNKFHPKYKDLTDEQVEALPEPDRALEKLFRQEVKQYADDKTPQEILDYMVAYMPEHNGKLPSEHSQDEVAKSNRWALNSFHKKYKDLTDEQVEALPEPDRTLEKLCRQNIKQYKTSQEILDYMLAYMPEHNGKLPSAASKDEVEKSNRRALDKFHQKYKDLTDEQVEALPEPDRTLEKLCRQNIKQIAEAKTPQDILDYMLAYMPEHNGKLPPPDSQDEVAKSNRWALNSFHKKYKDLTDEQVEALPEPDRTLEKLYRNNVRKYSRTAEE